MDSRLQTYLDRVEFWRLKEMEKREDLSYLFDQAIKAPFPFNFRPAVAEDIVLGAIIWYKEGDDGPFWAIVEELNYTGDDWKAFSFDGCRYGLNGAFVEVDNDNDRR